MGSDPASGRGRLPRGVTLLPRPRGGRRYRAAIRRGKGVVVHLGLYDNPWLAGLAHAEAARLIGRGDRGDLPIPTAEQPPPDAVRAMTALVRRRLGLAPPEPSPPERPPAADDLIVHFEVAVVGFWRAQADAGGDQPDRALDSAARRLVEAAGLTFWCRSAGHPTPTQALTDCLSRRVDRAFGRPDLLREILDDDGDEPDRLARWLVLPDRPTGGLSRGFRAEVRHRYGLGEPAEGEAGPPWAAVLGVSPPYTLETVRLAFRLRSRRAHPDLGGTAGEFRRLKAAYDAARAYLAGDD